MAEVVVAPLEGVTLGELYRLLDAQGKTLQTIQGLLNDRPTQDYVDRLERARDERERLQEAARAEREQLQNEAIKALQDNNRWLARAVIAALLTGLVGLAVAGIKLLAGA